MKRLAIILTSLCFVLVVRAQDTTAVLAAMNKLEKAFVEGDTSTTRSMLHPDLAFGHSNGWVQDRDQVVADMGSGYLRYLVMDRHELRIENHGDRAVVRERVSVKGTKEGKEFQVELFVMQLWEKGKKGWKLVLRQGAKQST